MKSFEKQVGGEHYAKMAIQPAEYIHRNGIGFMEGAAIKYLSRWRAKNGLEDLRKAAHMIELLLEMESASDLNTEALQSTIDGTVVPSDAQILEDAAFKERFPATKPRGTCETTGYITPTISSANTIHKRYDLENDLARAMWEAEGRN